MKDFFDGWKRIVGVLVIALAAIWLVWRIFPVNVKTALTGINPPAAQ